MSSLLREQASMINKFSGTSQVYNLVAEECGELIQAVMKMQRIDSNDFSMRQSSNQVMISVDEEIADVLICIERLQDKLQNYDRVNFFINKKIDRIANSIRNIVKSGTESPDIRKEESHVRAGYTE